MIMQLSFLAAIWLLNKLSIYLYLSIYEKNISFKKRS